MNSIAGGSRYHVIVGVLGAAWPPCCPSSRQILAMAGPGLGVSEASVVAAMSVTIFSGTLTRPAVLSHEATAQVGLGDRGVARALGSR